MTAPIEHSVALIEELCIGCTACVKACPTEAIRVRESKARIMEERCIDCGVCITTCPVHAKVAYTNLIHDIYKYRYRIALVPPEIFGQFPDELSPSSILFGIRKLGFHEVHELAPWMERVSAVQRLYFDRNGKRLKRPQISLLCPAVVRLIAVRFTSLLDNVISIRPPISAAAKWLTENKPKELGLRREEIGIFFLTPCPAQMTRVKNPLTDRVRYLDGAISISDVYGDIFAAAQK
ncbi:MAG TPA: 4Fe-4S dicluster domain-containing protein, partial [Proteobacteria bacterium]|nr:4Fe-4S dicluster domain-containing protein [Pseudomonadota bacterium]